MDRPHHERIEDPLFRAAVDLLDAGDAAGLRAHLIAQPALVRQRVVFEGGNYFTNPALLEFAAENPVRRGTLPANIVEVATVILDAGAKDDRPAMDGTLALVCSGRVPRECRVQIPLIDLLCDHGADPESGMLPALGHGELQAVEALLRRGAKMDLGVAAALGNISAARQLIAKSTSEERRRALALASQQGHAEIVVLLLDSGEDPNRYNPPGCHPHTPPLHQAVYYGHRAVVQLLVEHGAKLDIKDTIYGGTPIDWARHAGQAEIESYLRFRAELQQP